MIGSSDQWGIPELRLPREAADFYLLEFMAGVHGYKPAKPLLNRKVKFLADAFARYLGYAICSELEYVGSIPREYKWSGVRYKLRCRPGTVARKLFTASRKGNLNNLWFIRMHDRRRLTTLRAASTLFHGEEWEDGYGGRAWGDIADVLLAYHSKGLKPKLFVDTVWSIEHNGGTALDKCCSKFRGVEDLRKVLDHQAETDIYGLYDAASEPVRKMIVRLNKKVGGRWHIRRDLS